MSRVSCALSILSVGLPNNQTASHPVCYPRLFSSPRAKTSAKAATTSSSSKPTKAATDKAAKGKAAKGKTAKGKAAAKAEAEVDSDTEPLTASGKKAFKSLQPKKKKPEPEREGEDRTACVMCICKML